MTSRNRIRRPDWSNSTAESIQSASVSVPEPPLPAQPGNNYRSAQEGASMPPQHDGGRHPGQNKPSVNTAPNQRQPQSQPAPRPSSPPEQQLYLVPFDSGAPHTSSADETENQTASQENYISQKIYKINGKDKVIDFRSKLIMANLNDFANVHGCGGKGHAPNSTVGIVICDYTNGIGESSVTMRFNMEVEDMTLLYHVSNGILAGTSHGSPLLPYVSEKNNPYAKGSDGYVPVSRIEINYQPTRQDGNVSNYPWYIAITNYEAPLSEKGNGTTAHVGSMARNKRSAFINVSALEFGRAMVAVDRFIRMWEHRMLPVMDEAYRRIDAARQERQLNSGY